MDEPPDAGAVFDRLMQRLRAASSRGTDPAYPELPTIEEAWAIFRARPDVWAIQTDLGRLTRDGTLVQPPLQGQR